MHQHDPAQRLHELLPEGLAPQLGQQADQGCPLGSSILHHDSEELRGVDRVGVEEPEPIPPCLLHGPM